MSGGQPLDTVFELEERLRGKEPLIFAIRLRSGDSVASELEGSVELRSSGEVLLDIQGDLDSVDTQLSSSSDGRRLVVQAEGRDLVLPAPADFRNILAAGFIRLGMLDLLLRLLSGDTPYSADSLRRRYRLEAFAEVDAEPSRPDLADCLGHAFSVRDHLIEVAVATLWIDRFRGDPRERAQSVRVPRNVSTTEIYWDFRGK